MRKTIILLAVAVAAASCQKHPSLLTEPSQEIIFSPSGAIEASVSTKTQTVSSLSSFNVCCITGTPGSGENCVFNTPFSGASSFTGGKYWPKNDAGYKFYASNATMVHSAGGPSINASSSNDVVCAFLGNPTFRSTNKLVFNHIFARVGSCRIYAPAKYSVSNLSVSVTPKVSGTYKLFSGNGHNDGTGWSNTSNGSSVIIATGLDSANDNMLFLVPGDYSISASYTLSIGDYSESFTKSANLRFLAGKINNISATLPQGNASEITFSVEITDWTTNDLQADFN